MRKERKILFSAVLVLSIVVTGVILYSNFQPKEIPTIYITDIGTTAQKYSDAFGNGYYELKIKVKFISL